MGSKLLEEKCTVPLPCSNIIVKHIAAFRVCGHHPKTCMTAHHTWTLSSTLQIREYVSLRNIVTRLEFRVWITWPSCYWKYASTQPANNGRTCINTVLSVGSTDAQSGSKPGPSAGLKKKPQSVAIADISKCRVHLAQTKTLSKRHKDAKRIKGYYKHLDLWNNCRFNTCIPKTFENYQYLSQLLFNTFFQH